MRANTRKQSMYCHSSECFPPVTSITANSSFSVVSKSYFSYRDSIVSVVKGITSSSFVTSFRNNQHGLVVLVLVLLVVVEGTVEDNIND